MFNFRKLTAGTAIAAGLAVATLVPASVAAQDFPSRPLEFVAGYGPGGGHDTMLRSMAKIIAEENVADVATNVVNKPGGSSAAALGYLNSHEGDGHYLMAATSAFITTPLTSNVGLNYKDFTPIARLGIDPELLVVPQGSPFSSLEDIVSTERTLNVGGTSTGGIEHITTIMVAEALGADLNFVPFQGDGEVLAALLSNQLDFAITNPGAVADFIESGRLSALAISTEERVDLLPEVPTFVEQGYDVTISLFRGVVAPAGISDEEKDYLATMVEDLSKTEAWTTQYLNPNSVVGDFLGPDEFAQYLEKMNGIYETTLTDLGIIGG